MLKSILQALSLFSASLGGVLAKSSRTGAPNESHELLGEVTDPAKAHR